MQVVTGEEMKEVDRYAIESLGLKEELLMENAGRAVAEVIMEDHSLQEKAAILIGKGNNGGDGFVVARVLIDHGMDVDVWLLADPNEFEGAACYHKEIYENLGREWKEWDASLCEMDDYDVVIDAMLGTGVRGPLRPPYKEAVLAVNKGSADVISIDIPSGVPSESGKIPETVIYADTTVVIQAPKCSAYLYPATDCYGAIRTVDIGLRKVIENNVPIRRKVWTKNDVCHSLPHRIPNAHKGTHGKGLLIGGSKSMPGAVTLAASACLNSGAGLLTTAAPSSVMPVVHSQLPETMGMPLPEQGGAIAGDLMGMDFNTNPYQAVAAGPGLGREKTIKPLVRRLLTEVNAPLLLDADALYFLPELEQEVKARNAPLIITPHPGEMSRLTGEKTEKINNQRFTLSREFAMEKGCYLVLKGPHTIVTTPDGDQFINTSGNEALARGGTGDVLTGLILGLLLQGKETSASVMNAVYLHGLTADIAVKKSRQTYAMTASDFIHLLPLAFRSIISSF
ncbi:NAD(P)H-hydrate dehydratase [Alteribacillus iranensis]|uniref:Bifunctional NAD(P)H-hydrate repair enzyme n=1 Tax=Alteribacillus iranensis TaxID=930128 RepID=A0A1I2DF49_9BACI|nr:NAD(P)H-hydrate dehydratase [Alteribacillus iranensis]SFE79001.1 NAD(P)H-hydrate epimerase [Alteribacillus iranensis]